MIGRGILNLVVGTLNTLLEIVLALATLFAVAYILLIVLRAT